MSAGDGASTSGSGEGDVVFSPAHVEALEAIFRRMQDRSSKDREDSDVRGKADEPTGPTAPSEPGPGPAGRRV